MVRRKRHYKIATQHKTLIMPSKSGNSDSLMVAVSNRMLIAISCFSAVVANDWMVLASRTCAVKALLLLMVCQTIFFIHFVCSNSIFCYFVLFRYTKYK
jgi:hypothetical protein